MLKIETEVLDRLRDAEEKIDRLEREQAEQRIVVSQLLSKIDATAAFYEQRVDHIYRRVDVALREMLGYGSVDSVSELEVEAVLSKVMRSFEIPFVVPDQLKLAVLGELLPGTIASPLTLHGFRVNRRRARETGDGIEMYGNENGIAIYGPYKSLRPGNYRIVAELLQLSPAPPGAGPGALLIDVFSSERQEVVAVGEVRPQAGDQEVDLPLTFSWRGGSVEVRVSNNTSTSWLLKSFRLKSD